MTIGKIGGKMNGKRREFGEEEEEVLKFGKGI